MQEGTQTGVVTYFCKSRGHGFIQPSDYQVSSTLSSPLSLSLLSSLLSSSWPRSDLQRIVCCCLTMDIGNPIITSTGFFVYTINKTLKLNKFLSTTRSLVSGVLCAQFQSTKPGTCVEKRYSSHIFELICLSVDQQIHKTRQTQKSGIPDTFLRLG